MESVKTINWFPGHMAKTNRQLQEHIKKADLVMELCDARLPTASRNPDLNRLIGSKERLLLMNKADLADPSVTKRWQQFFSRKALTACPVNASALRTKEIMNMIDRSTASLKEKALQKGVRKTIRVMILGIPNVGKSTLINQLRGSRIVETGDRPGVTRSNQWVRISPYLELLDTPGLLWPKLENQKAAMRLCCIGAIPDDISDITTMTLFLLEELIHIVPRNVADRFHLEDRELSLSGEELLEAVCRGRGWLLKGNRYDYERGCRIILDEFRGGKLGRISLETPPEET